MRIAAAAYVALLAPAALAQEMRGATLVADVEPKEPCELRLQER